LDLWAFFDLFCGFANCAAFNYIGNAKIEKFHNQEAKYQLDYVMIFILVLAWIRFFSYFLVINSIGKLTITLFFMIKETMIFLIVLLSYLIIMTTIFAICFNNANPVDHPEYLTIAESFRTLFDYMVAEMERKNMKNYDVSHSIFYMFHVLFSAIFLVNYLVAILSMVYEVMN
jgi:hypothetical protein